MAAYLQLEMLALAAEVDEYDNNRNLRRQRVFRDRSQAFELDEYRFKRLFRVKKQIAYMLCDRLGERLSGQNSLSIPANVKILVGLRFFAVGCYQRAIGQDFYLAVSQPTVSRCVTSVSQAIVDVLMAEEIKFPTTDEHQLENKIGFCEIAGVPGVIGVIDGSHIAIIAPNSNDNHFRENLFVNRKGFHSLNVQFICDHKLKFINANARYPGSAHDSHIFRMSQVSVYLQESYINGRRNSWLLGDSGYPLRPWLQIPILNAPDGSAEEIFTKALVKTRQIVERSIGVLKQVFRCLLQHRTLHYHPTQAALIVYACTILHNLRRDGEHRPEDDTFTDTESEEDSEIENDGNQDQIQRRRQRQRQQRRERRSTVWNLPNYVPQPNENWLQPGKNVRAHLVRRFQ